MPNDCWNHMTITATADELATLIRTEFANVPDWALLIKHRGAEGVVLNLWSRWHPDFEWLEKLTVTYPSCWVKNEWSEEGGMAGVWVGSQERGIQRLEWQDMCIEEKVHRLGMDQVK